MCSMTFSYAFSQKDITYKDGDAEMKGYFVPGVMKAREDRKKVPGVVIIHQWMGLSAHEKASAAKIAGLGYHALAADIYGTGHMPANKDEAGKEAGKYKTDYKLFQSRIDAAVKEIVKLGADPDNIVVIGYCFGGSGAIEAARANLRVKGIVSFHGGLKKDASRSDEKIGPKVLVLHGADDPTVSKAEIDDFQKEMNAGSADWQMISYSGAVHGFTQKEAGTDNSKGVAYNEKADQRSWEHMKLFLAEVFGKR